MMPQAGLRMILLFAGLPIAPGRGMWMPVFVRPSRDLKREKFYSVERRTRDQITGTG
jgi:hypothetical protein